MVYVGLQNGELHPVDWVYVRQPGQKPKKRYGIAINVQNIYKWISHYRKWKRR